MPYSHKPAQLNARIWALAWPMILANLSLPLFGLVDTAVLGHLPDDRHLGAVAIGASLLSLSYWAFGFLRMGTTGASAQSRSSDADALLLKALCSGLILSLLIYSAAPLLRGAGLQLMNTDAALLPLADNYLRLRLLSAPAVLGSYAVIGWLLGQQRARWPLAIALCSNLLNIALDLLLIIGLGMASEGAAIASAMSEYAGFALALFAVREPLQRALRRGVGQSLRRGIPLRRFARSNAQIFVRTTALLFSFSFFTAQGAAQGSSILAANAILMQLVLAAAYGMDGFAHAAEALAGRAYGDRDRRAFIAVCKTCGRWALYSATAASLLLLLGEQAILSAMTNIHEVRTAASQYYGWLVLLPLLSAASYCYDGIFIGTLRTAAMQYSMLLCVAGIYLPLWYLCRDWGNHGLWLAFATFNACRGISLALCFQWLFSPQHWPASGKK